jgi:hypothetical protein
MFQDKLVFFSWEGCGFSWDFQGFFDKFEWEIDGN